jgi:hypothetical protein
MVAVRGMIRFQLDPLFKVEATRGTQCLTELYLDFRASRQIYPNGKKASP